MCHDVCKSKITQTCVIVVAQITHVFGGDIILLVESNAQQCSRADKSVISTCFEFLSGCHPAIS